MMVTPNPGAAARGRPRSRRLATLAAALPILLALAGGAARAEEAPLRVCADPDNLPFTSRDPATPGFFLELARHVADQLGRRMEPVWAATYAPQRMLRTTLLAHRCDLFPGVPAEADFMAPRVILSRPVLALGYALVAPGDAGIHSLADLRGRRVAVQFGSPAQDLLATRDDVTPVTVTTPEEGMQALAQRRAAAALLWGPSAGYLNRTALHGSVQVIPVAGPHLQWKAAIAFNRDDAALRDAVDRALGADGPVVSALAVRYGFPAMDAPPAVTQAAESDGVEALQIPNVTKDSEAPPAAAPAAPKGDADAVPAIVSAAPATPQQVAEGNSLFNSTCAHCHGPDAVQSQQRINLRLLQHRYGPGMDQVFYTTVTHGRPDKGMPNWSGAFTDQQFHDILAFLHSVQDKP